MNLNTPEDSFHPLCPRIQADRAPGNRQSLFSALIPNWEGCCAHQLNFSSGSSTRIDCRTRDNSGCSVATILKAANVRKSRFVPFPLVGYFGRGVIVAGLAHAFCDACSAFLPSGATRRTGLAFMSPVLISIESNRTIDAIKEAWVWCVSTKSAFLTSVFVHVFVAGVTQDLLRL